MEDSGTVDPGLMLSPGFRHRMTERADEWRQARSRDPGYIFFPWCRDCDGDGSCNLSWKERESNEMMGKEWNWRDGEMGWKVRTEGRCDSGARVRMRCASLSSADSATITPWRRE